MKAISIKQPWAYLILNQGKDVENRTWKTNVRGRVLIHASQAVDEAAVQAFGLEDVYFPTGCVVGSVEIVDCVESSKSKWFTGQQGWVLRDPIKLTPFKYKGQLGFFEVKEVMR